MKFYKYARLSAVLAVPALAAVSLSVIAVSDDSSADDTAYVSNFSELNNALNQGIRLIIMTDSITLKDSIIIEEGQRIDVRNNCTLTIPKDREICNRGHIFVAGKCTLIKDRIEVFLRHVGCRSRISSGQGIVRADHDPSVFGKKIKI